MKSKFRKRMVNILSEEYDILQLAYMTDKELRKLFLEGEE